MTRFGVRRAAHAFSRLTLAGVLVCAGCGGNTDADRRKPDDSAGGSTAGTGGGAGATGNVWRSSATGFQLSSRGGLTGVDEVFFYSVASRRLSYDCSSFCYVDGAYTERSEQNVELTVEQAGDLLTTLGGLSTTTTLLCGFDAPEMTLMLELSAAAERYESNFYAGCEQSIARGRYVDFNALGQLRARLVALLPE